VGYASVLERIGATSGFRVWTDKHVLLKLAEFANFKTGEGARPSTDTLVKEAHLPKRTIERALQRLEADGWIAVTARQHRRPTTYRICVDQLATGRWGAKATEPLAATGVGYNPTDLQSLSATGDALAATDGGQNGLLSATGGGPSPVRTDPLSDPQARARRDDVTPKANSPTKNEGAKPERFYQPALGPLDVSAEARVKAEEQDARERMVESLRRRTAARAARWRQVSR